MAAASSTISLTTSRKLRRYILNIQCLKQYVSAIGIVNDRLVRLLQGLLHANLVVVGFLMLYVLVAVEGWLTRLLTVGLGGNIGPIVDTLLSTPVTVFASVHGQLLVTISASASSLGTATPDLQLAAQAQLVAQMGEARAAVLTRPIGVGRVANALAHSVTSVQNARSRVDDALEDILRCLANHRIKRPDGGISERC